jgi:thiamine-monophosphate kinase
MGKSAGEGEDALLRWLRRRLAKIQPGEELLGDDAAKIAVREDLAITMDSQIEGVHFFPGLPPEMPPEYDRRVFFRSFLRHCRRFGVRLAGGDLSQASHVQIVITLLGQRQGRFLERSGAAPGDVIYLGGEIGLSSLGFLLLAAGARLAGGKIALPDFLEKKFHPAARHAVRRHLLPTPQLELGSRLALGSAAGAALDVSDGLAKDLHRLCRESRVGASIDAERLPMPAAGRRLAARLAENLPAGQGRSWLDLALGGGEDYVLLFTLPPGEPPPAGSFAIGRATRSRTILLNEAGRRRPLPPLGFDHLS